MIFHLKIDRFIIFLIFTILIVPSCNYKIDKNDISSNYQFACQNLDVQKSNSDEYICKYLKLYGESCFFDKDNLPPNIVGRIIDFPKNDLDTLFVFTFYGETNCHYMTCKYMPAYQFTPYHQALNDPKIKYSFTGFPLSDNSYNEIINNIQKFEFTIIKRKRFFSNSNNTLFEIIKNNKYEYCIQSKSNTSDTILNLLKSKIF